MASSKLNWTEYLTKSTGTTERTTRYLTVTIPEEYRVGHSVVTYRFEIHDGVAQGSQRSTSRTYVHVIERKSDGSVAKVHPLGELDVMSQCVVRNKACYLPRTSYRGRLIQKVVEHLMNDNGNTITDRGFGLYRQSTVPQSKEEVA